MSLLNPCNKRVFLDAENSYFIPLSDSDAGTLYAQFQWDDGSYVADVSTPKGTLIPGVVALSIIKVPKGVILFDGKKNHYPETLQRSTLSEPRGFYLSSFGPHTPLWRSGVQDGVEYQQLILLFPNAERSETFTRLLGI